MDIDINEYMKLKKTVEGHKASCKKWQAAHPNESANYQKKYYETKLKDKRKVDDKLKIAQAAACKKYYQKLKALKQNPAVCYQIPIVINDEIEK